MSSGPRCSPPLATAFTAEIPACSGQRDAVLCTDTVGREDSLHLHVSNAWEGGCAPSCGNSRRWAPVEAGRGHGLPCRPWGLGCGLPVGRWASPQAQKQEVGEGLGIHRASRDHLYRGR